MDSRTNGRNSMKALPLAAALALGVAMGAWLAPGRAIGAPPGSDDLRLVRAVERVADTLREVANREHRPAECVCRCEGRGP